MYWVGKDFHLSSRSSCRSLADYVTEGALPKAGDETSTGSPIWSRERILSVSAPPKSLAPQGASHLVRALAEIGSIAKLGDPYPTIDHSGFAT